MKYVEVYRTLGSPEIHQVVCLVCTLGEDGNVRFDGDLRLADFLIQQGASNHLESVPRVVFPADGLPFMEMLCFYFSTAYVRASRVLEGDHPRIPGSRYHASPDDRESAGS